MRRAKEDIVLIGGGGHCLSCIDVIEDEGRFRIAGIVDKKEKVHEKVLNYPIIASDEDIPKLAEVYKNFLVTIGQIKNPERRMRIFSYLKELGRDFPVIISPGAYVSGHASIDEGTIVMNRAFVNANARIGKNSIINSGAVIEHDVRIGSHCHISTLSVVNGSCVIDDSVFIGSGAVIANGLKITRDTVIGAGSAVLRSVEKAGTYAGRPARLLEKVLS